MPEMTVAIATDLLKKAHQSYHWRKETAKKSYNTKLYWCENCTRKQVYYLLKKRIWICKHCNSAYANKKDLKANRPLDKYQVHGILIGMKNAVPGMKLRGSHWIKKR